LDLPAKIEYLPRRHEVDVAYSDHSRCRQVFAAVPETPLEEGLSRMATWVRKIGTRSSRDFSAIEITEKLPASWTTAR
jgi:UDP-glucose 4-epimerase